MPEHYVVIEGLQLPAALGGHAALDFCNTRAGWDAPAAKEYLTGYDQLAVWAGFAGLLAPERVAGLRADAARHPDSADIVVERARQVRNRLYRVLRHPANLQDFDRFQADLHAAASRLRLRRGDHAIHWEIEPEAGLAAPLHAAVWAGGQLLVSSERTRVRACPGADCGWLFLDRTGRRRWCTMGTCGNREKARRFAQRRPKPPADAP